MGKCKTKAIQTDIGILRHNQAYPVIVQAYSEPCVTLAYSQPWYLQNPGIIIIFTNYNYFRSISLPRSPLHETNLFFLMQF